jgi:porin
MLRNTPMLRNSLHTSSITALLTTVSAATTLAQDASPAPEPDPVIESRDDITATPEGILPLIDYSGDLLSRSRLTGDWGGTRTELAEKGITFDLEWTQTSQGVVSGGQDIGWEYGGSFDMATTLDLQRMGVMPGALVKSRVESRYGDTVNGISGVLLPVNTDGYFPLTSPADDEVITITELNYTQFLSESFGLVIGKFQTLDGDPNEFAGGRGRSQFMNFNFIANGVTGLTVPYSTLGAGIVFLPNKQIVVSSLLASTSDSSTTSGFDSLDDGWTWTAEADFQYSLGSLPGGANVGGIYAFDGEFANLGGIIITPPGAPALASTDNSWAVYASNWQYIYTLDPASGNMDLTNGKPDLRGLGMFARIGFADSDTNPVEFTVSGGLSGRGLIPSRDHDVFGVGYYYTKIENASRLAPLSLEDSSQALEAFYNFAISPAVGLTLDVQWIDGASQNLDAATAVGVRLDMSF